MYLFPNHDKSVRGYKTAMGKKLFIMGHDTKLHVWHLELNRLESFEVPENFKRCVTEGESVLVVSQSSDVYIWKFGGKLQRIDSEYFSRSWFSPVLLWASRDIEMSRYVLKVPVLSILTPHASCFMLH